MRTPYDFAGEAIPPGTRRIVDVPLSMMSDHTPASLSVQVIHGRNEGPTIFVSAAVHGDEIIGVEIVRRIARLTALRRVAGTVLLVPIVNAFGFISHSRYMPDRRDLNRSFPGSANGSLAARLAHLFLKEVVTRCDYGIDLHSAAIHRTNFPQIRVDVRDAKARRMAEAFGAPVIVNSSLREGSLRGAAYDLGIPVMVFEAGEALRFDEFAIRIGVKGVLGVMAELGMIRRERNQAAARPPIARKTTWLRAPDGGVLRAKYKVGARIRQGDVLGVISDPFGTRETEVRAEAEGLIIGRTNLPVVNQGDALFHLASVPVRDLSESSIEALEGEIEEDPLFDEDEIL